MACRLSSPYAVLTLLLSALLLSSVLAQGDDLPTFPSDTAPRPVYGQYIVLLAKNVNPKNFVVGSLRGFSNAKVIQVYDTVLNGFAMSNFPPEKINGFKNNPHVLDIIQDYESQATATVESPATWGLDRIDQRALPLNGQYSYTNDGSGVRVYVLDMMVAPITAEFGNRIGPCKAYGSGSCDVSILTGDHGTHVAGTIGSKTYGVAKGATIYPVPVLNSTGYGYNSAIAAGVDYVARQKAANPGIPMIINMSLGGKKDSALDTAVNNAVANNGVVVVVAAGNSKSDSCNLSPSGATNAITVAASVKNDTFAQYSCYGTCVDIIAPGSGITSISRNGNPLVMSGTSMAAPHVSGTMALYLKDGKTTANMLKDATAGKITSLKGTTANLLVYTGTT